jgi:malate dehydrogenase (oxaloacetate-decarboxylating)
MEEFRIEHDAAGPFVRVRLRGHALLNHPMYNKGSAFTADERRALGLEGLLPPLTSSEEVQCQRAYGSIARKTDPLEQYVGLAGMQDRNETLFYRVVLDNLEALAPIVYTPTVGRACQQYSQIFRRGRGIWITPGHRGRIAEVLGNAPYADVRLIVVTDNERILGLGDQGAGGMGIPVGKLVLYTVGAGLHPSKCLPVSLDVGTDNRELLADPLYLGWREKRLRGPEYDALVEEFVAAVEARFPKALLQWEDFKKQNAFDLLDRYRERLLSFNDDIQGTAAVALAGVVAATRISGVAMREQRVVILGAGAAGIGIARQLRDAFRRAGLEGAALTRAIALIDSSGLLVEGRKEQEKAKLEFAWPREIAAELGVDAAAYRDLARMVEAIRPTVLLGTSGQPGVFDERVVAAMGNACARPVIFPFSNPTASSEAKPVDLIRWTDGRAIVATGSPFDPVEHGGRTIRVGQGNNVYIFPGVGLGALAAGARRVTDSMFTVASEVLASMVEPADLDAGSLYPSLSKLREVSRRIGVAVAREAAARGVADPLDELEAAARVERWMWYPRYPRYVAV